jgi:periplasmic protein TonB
MFDAVLSKQQHDQRYGVGTAVALLIYAAAIGGAVLLFHSNGEAKLTQQDVAVTLYTAMAQPAPPPPPPPGPTSSSPEPSRPQHKPKPVKVVEPKPVEPKPVEPTPVDKVEAAPTPEPAEEAATEPEAPSGGGGVIGGVQGGVQGGTVGGTLGGTIGGTGTGTQVLPFGPGMMRPTQIAGATPTYTREARAARVEGKVLVRCVISITGEVQNCQVIKGVPMLTEIVLESLRSSRFTPVQYQGRPQAIQYLFTFNFKLS